MRIILFAFTISILIHILIFIPIIKKEENQNSASTSKKVDKSSVHFVRLQTIPKKAVQKKEDPKPKKVEPKKIEKPKEFKKVEAKKIVPQKKVIKEKPKKIIPKPIEKQEVAPTFTKQVPVKPSKKRETVENKSLENFLLTEPVPVDNVMLDEITQSYLRLYGEEYNSFTKVQKVYLQKNLKNIGRITQKYLKYPQIAVRTAQQGMNIVEFVLHPNGDISDLRITNSSGYSTLDENTIETIEIAYKDYPRPKENTKIKIYVYYKLY